MSFYIDTTDIDLGDTPIENIFINDFMPMANGTYVKVYLLGYKYAHDRDEAIRVNNTTIARHLGIPLTDVLDAWNFWESKGIVKKVVKSEEDSFDYKVEFLNLKQLYINNNYKPVAMGEVAVEPRASKSLSNRDLIEANEIPRVNQMFNTINDIFKRPLVPNEKRTVLEWMQDYNMNPDIIEKAFYISMEKKGRRNINYVGGIIKNWYDSGITTMEAYMESLKESNDRYNIYIAVMRALGLKDYNIPLGNRELIDSWIDDYQMGEEIILEACKIGVNRSPNPNLNYINGILKDWQQKDIRTLEAIGQEDQKKKDVQLKARKDSSPKLRANKFHNFKQRTSSYTEDDLERIAELKRMEHFRRVKGEK